MRTGHYPERRGWARVLVGTCLVVASAWASARDDERRPDVVELIDGKRLEGRVLYIDDSELVFRGPRSSKERIVERGDIADLTLRRHDLDDWLDRVAVVDLEDPRALLELAALATSRTLHGEAEIIGWVAATAESPAVDEARAAIGMQDHRGKWRIRIDRDWFRLEDLEDNRAWSDKVTLTTDHYVIHSSAPIRNAALLALDIAALHRACRDHLSPKLRLLEPEEPLVVHLYGRDREAPLPYERPDGAFLVDDRVLHVPVEFLADRPDDVRRVLAREVVRQYLHETTVESRQGRGPMPPWIDEGLGGLAADGLRGGPAAATIDWGSPPRRAAAAHFRPTTSRPEDAGRVVGYGLLDFASTRHAAYRRSQSASLLFVLTQLDPVAADTMLREALVGRSSFGKIEKLYDRTDDELNREWDDAIAAIVRS